MDCRDDDDSIVAIQETQQTTTQNDYQLLLERVRSEHTANLKHTGADVITHNGGFDAFIEERQRMFGSGSNKRSHKYTQQSTTEVSSNGYKRQCTAIDQHTSATLSNNSNNVGISNISDIQSRDINIMSNTQQSATGGQSSSLTINTPHQSSPATESSSRTLDEIRKESRIKEKCKMFMVTYVHISDDKSKRNGMLKELKCKSDQHSKDRWSPQKQEAHKARDRKRKQQGKKSNEKSSPTPNDSKTPGLAPVEECVPEVVISVDEPVKKAIQVVTRTCRNNGKHQASVCVACDRNIKGTETIHQLSKERILLNKHRLGVATYEKHFVTSLNPTLVKQYEIQDLQGLLLSPRSYREGDNFEACSCCNSSLIPSVAKKSTKPPKWSIANGFVVGHIPRSLKIKDTNGYEYFQSIDDHQISDILSVALSLQRPFGYIFSWYGGAHESIKGQLSFFEMNQSHIGGVMNHFRSVNTLLFCHSITIYCYNN